MKHRVYTKQNQIPKKRKTASKPRKESEPEHNPNGIDVPGLYKQQNGATVEIKHLKDTDGFIRHRTLTLTLPRQRGTEKVN